MRSWKSAERRIAAELGGERVPVTGRGRGDAPDVRHETLSIEIKTRKKLPDWIQKAMRQAQDAATSGQIPVAILHQDGQRYDEALVVMRLEDLKERI